MYRAPTYSICWDANTNRYRVVFTYKDGKEYPSPYDYETQREAMAHAVAVMAYLY